jgi:hypothetical protein
MLVARDRIAPGPARDHEILDLKRSSRRAATLVDGNLDIAAHDDTRMAVAPTAVLFPITALIESYY